MKVIVVRLFEGALVVAALLLLRGERPVLGAVPDAGQPRPSGYANPAAIYCGDLGYAYEIRRTERGDVGVCKFPDASACDAWDFLEGKCGSRHSFCAQQGLRTEMRSDGKNPYSREYAVCVDKSGAKVGSVVALTNLEEKATKTGCSEPPPSFEEQEDAPAELFAMSVPASFDWRARPKGNYVTNVRDQGQCGSCWAFASAGVAEAALNIANGRVGNNYNLAEEYLVSGCSGAGTCCGGYPSTALGYIKTSGIPDEACLPYVDGNSSTGCYCGTSGCTSSCTYRTGGKCSDKNCTTNRCSNYATRLTKLNAMARVSGRAAIKAALVSKGPLSASMWMGGDFNADGVYTCSTAPRTSHVIVLVGYDDAGGYWIAKNSWNSSWNGDGYFKIAYGQCLVEDWVYYGTVARNEPIANQPAGAITDRTPTFQWGRLGAATQYQVELKKGGSIIYTKTIAATSCKSTPCSTTPTKVLGYGAYTWRVRAFISGGWRGWSPAKSFSVLDPLVPVPKSPTGAIEGFRPTYTWTKVLNATDYEYELVSGTTIVYTKSVTSAACDTTTCADAPADELSANLYKWRVRAMIGGVWQAYSAYKTFSTGFDSQFQNDSTNWLPRPGAPWTLTSETIYTYGVPYQYSSISYNYSYSDFTYTARVQRLSSDLTYGGTAGMIVRGTPAFDTYNDWNTAYEFLYSSYYGDFIVLKAVGGNWTVLQNWTLTDKIVSNGWNTLKVAAAGSSLEFYINDTLVWSGTDSAISSGQVGLLTYDGGLGPAEEFDVDWALLTVGAPSSVGTQTVDTGQIPALHPLPYPPGTDSQPDP